MSGQNTDSNSRPPLPGGTSASAGQSYPAGSTQSMQASDAGNNAGNASGGAKEAASSAIASVKESGGRLADEAKQYAGDMANRAKDKGRSLFEQQKETAVGQMDGVAHALRNTADQLQDDGQPQVARYIGMAADQLESVGGRLRNKDLDSLIHDAQDLARRSPGAFLAGTVAVGFLLARFMKSSADQRRESTQNSGRGMPAARVPVTGAYATPSALDASTGTVLAGDSDTSAGNPHAGAYDRPAKPGAASALDSGAGSVAGDSSPSSPKRSNQGDNFYGNR